MLKNKLFCSMVVFAVAAIFATTFVACDNGSTNDVYHTEIFLDLGTAPGDVVIWTPIAEGYGTLSVSVTNANGYVKGPAAGWYDTPADGSGTIIETTDLTTVTEAGKIGGTFTQGDVWGATVLTGSMAGTQGFFKADVANILTATGLAVGDIVQVAASAETTTSVSNKSSDDGAKVWKLTKYTSTGKVDVYALGSALEAAATGGVGYAVAGSAETTAAVTNKTSAADKAAVWKITKYTSTGKVDVYALGSALEAAATGGVGYAVAASATDCKKFD